MRPSIYGAIEQMRMVDLLTNAKKKKKPLHLLSLHLYLLLYGMTPDPVTALL